MQSNRGGSSTQVEQRVLVLGIGNLLWADEGFGVRAVEFLRDNYALDDNVTLMDGGTQGIYLVQYIRDADILIVFDAVDYGLPGGTLKRVEGAEVPRFLGCRKVSLHQTGFQEVLAMAEMLGDYPSHLLLIGVQPVELDDYGGSLRPQVKAQIQPAVDMALAYLAGFGIGAWHRPEPLKIDTAASGAISDILVYETERPSEMQAWRKGDARVLQSKDFHLACRPSPVDGVSVGVDQHLEKYRDKD